MPLNKEKCKEFFRTHLLTILTVFGVVLGLILGSILRTIKGNKWWSKREVMYVQFIGDIYLRILTCLILPLLVSAVISSVGALELKSSWKIAARSVTWFVVTKYLAVLEGIFLVVLTKPGVGGSVDGHSPLNGTKNVLIADKVLDIFRNVFPENIVQSSMWQTHTVLLVNDSLPIREWEITFEYHDSMNLLGMIMFSLLLGLAVAIMSVNAQPIISFFETLSRSMMMAIGWALWFSPVGVLSLVAAKLIEVEDLPAMFERLGIYFITVLIGLFIHSLVVIPGIYFLITRKSPFQFYGKLTKTLITAFGTASSTASVPVTIECLEKNCKLDHRVVKFTVPLGTTMNLDGTALYEAVAVIFIAQVRQVDLNFGELALVSFTVTAACLGGGGVPQAGIMTMVMILSSLGLPTEDVSLIIAVDWLLDRFRTTVNVLGDAFGAAIVEHLSKAELRKMNQGEQYEAVTQHDIELPDRSLPININ